MVCLDNTTAVEKNSGKFNKKSTKEMVIGVAIGTTLFAVILIVVFVLMRNSACCEILGQCVYNILGVFLSLIFNIFS